MLVADKSLECMTLAELAAEIIEVDGLRGHGAGVSWVGRIGLEAHRMAAQHILASRPAASRDELAARVYWIVYEADRYGIASVRGPAMATLTEDLRRLCAAPCGSVGGSVGRSGDGPGDSAGGAGQGGRLVSPGRMVRRAALRKPGDRDRR